MPGALTGVKVVEVASYVTGPFAGAMLGDLGADVIKVEEPGHGDPFRGWGDDQYSPTFCALNRNKRSVTLDLHTSAGREILLDIIDSADVVIENHRPGIAEQMGFGYDAVRARNPRLIYCSITGFGGSGPYSQRPGYDTVGQALSGLLSLLTNVGQPEPMGISLSDHITGIYACCGILSALAARSATGEGQLVTTSLLQATMHLIGENAAHYFHSNEAPIRLTRVRQAQVFAFEAGDNLSFIVHLSSPAKFWEGLVQVVGRPEWLEDLRFATRAARQKNYEELAGELQKIFRTAPRDHWLSELNRLDVPSAPLNTIAEAFDDPQVRHLGIKMTYDHPVRGAVSGVAPGFALSDTPLEVRLAPPTLGEHTAKVLQDLNLSREHLGALLANGATGSEVTT
ncbi:MAG: CoA transferase [Actinomycetota bacterium]|nr:MAG: CoA transferase [Actinomycetota bacterium]